MASSDDYHFMDSTSARDSSLRPRRPELAAFDEVLAAAADGQSWAFDRLYRELSTPLQRFLAARGADDPSGLVNDVLVEVFRSLPNFEGDNTALRGFAFHVARRRLVDNYRAQSRRVPTSRLDDAFNNTPTTGDQQPDDVPLVALTQAASKLDVLTAEQRDVIVLRVVCDLSLAETSVVLDKPVSAIKAMQRRALKTLRRHYPTATDFSH